MTGEPSDEELLMSGAAEDFGLLYRRRHQLVRAYLARRLPASPDLVLDLVAETFARALERRAQFDVRRGTAIGWLLVISRNLLLDAIRRGRVADDSRRRLGMESIVLEDEQLTAIEAREESSTLRALLDALPSEQRAAVEARVLAEEPYAVTAAAFGCSEQVVRKRVSRGLSAIRQGLVEET